MKKHLILPAIFLLCVSVSFGQFRNSDDVKKKIKELNAGKNIFWESPAPGFDSSKIIAVGNKFDKEDYRRAGIETMDFAIAVFLFSGILKDTPDELLFTFRAKSKKPVFAALHSWKVTIGNETVDFGDARYAARAQESKEYLNFKISRENLEKIAKATSVKMKIGGIDMKLTAEQLRTISNFLKVSNLKSY